MFFKCMSILTSVVRTDSEEFGNAQTYRRTDRKTDRAAYAINKMDFNSLRPIDKYFGQILLSIDSRNGLAPNWCHAIS